MKRAERLTRGCRKLTSGLGLLMLGAFAWTAGAAGEKSKDELGSTAAPSSAEFAAQAKLGITRVPFTKKPPKIDGVMEPGEWEDSAACYGAWQLYVHDWSAGIAVEEKQPVWYFAYDTDYLYVAQRSPVFPKASWLLCRGKYHDVMDHQENGVLGDDNLQLALIPSTKEGPFFKWMCNPINTYVDLYLGKEATAEIDYRFQSKFDLAGKFDENAWVTEWRIPLKSMRFGQYDGRDPKYAFELPLRDDTMWMVGTDRSIGGTADASKLFSRRGGTWNQGTNQRLVFDSKGVTAQVTELGDLLRDKVNFNLTLKNHGERSETVKVGFYIENNKELVVVNEEDQFVELLPGEVKRIQIKKDKIGITPQGNAIWVDIRTLTGKIVYRDILMTFHAIDGWPMFQETFVDGMKYTRPPRQPFSYNYAYYPSVNKLRAVVDTDVFGVDDAVKTAVEAKVKLLSAEDGAEVATLTIPLEQPLANAMAQTFGGRRGEAVLAFDKLKPGDYKTVCLLYDANKKIVSDQTSPSFKQASFPWENNSEGLEDTVWQPYTPLEADAGGKLVKTVMHEIQLEASGLPAQLVIKGKNPNFGPQLRAPLRLEATAGGKRSPFAASGDLKRVKDWKSEQVFEAKGAAGAVTIRGQTQIDCDGTLTYDLYYQSGATSIETLELVLDLAGPVDLFQYRGTGFNVKGNEVLGKKGPVVWNSRDDAAPRELFYGNFTPEVLIGNGDRCFLWVCETDRGMKLLADKPAMQIEKNEKGEFTLRVFLVNEPGAVGEERHVQFALMTQPDRPKPVGYRKFMWSADAAESGGGVNIGDGTSKYSIHLENEEDYAKFAPLFKGKINQRAYTDAVSVGFNMPGVRDYCYLGEFTGSQLGRPQPRFVPPGSRHPVTGRPIETIFDQSTARWRWCQSQVNCAVYWRSKQIRQCFAQGFMWDNGTIGQVDMDPVVGNAYELPKHKFHAAGRQQYAFHFMLPRQFFKRLARINTQAGLECTSNDNGGETVIFNGSYFRDNVMWESNYVSPERPHMKGYSQAESRYFTETYSGRTGYYDINVGWILAAGGDPSQDRSLLADALLYDVGVLPTLGHSLANAYPRKNVREALEKFGYLDEDAATVEYIPYWRSDSYYQYGFGVPAANDEFADADAKGLAEQLKGVFCSIYKNKKTGKALLVLANGTDQPISENLIIKPLLLDGRAPTKCTDVEVNEEIKFGLSPKDKKPLANTFNPIFIAPWQFRMVVVE